MLKDQDGRKAFSSRHLFFSFSAEKQDLQRVPKIETHCERWHSRLLARQFGFFGQSAFEPSYRPDRFRAVWAWPSLLPSVEIWFVLRISAPLCGTQKKNSPLKNHDIISEKSHSTILPIWNERVQRPMATTHISGVLINMPFKLYPVYQCEQDPILFVTREKMAQPAFGGNGRHVAQKSPAESATSKQSRMLSIPFYLYSIRTVVRKNSKKNEEYAAIRFRSRKKFRL